MQKVKKTKNCERCSEPKIKSNVENLVTYQKSILRNKEEATIEKFAVKELCDDCFEIVRYAASPESCGDKDILKQIQDAARRNPLTPKS